jgi:predicted amidohydrolase
MANVPRAARQSSDVIVGLLIKNLQQWALEDYGLNPVDIDCNKNTLKLLRR